MSRPPSGAASLSIGLVFGLKFDVQVRNPGHELLTPLAFREPVCQSGQPLKLSLNLLLGLASHRFAGNDDGGFNYTTSVDEKRFVIASQGANDCGTLTAAAVGSGAFPVAFRPKAIDHSIEEYVSRGVRPIPQPPAAPVPGETYLVWKGCSPRPFAHTDGGVLQNQPLGIARDLVFDAILVREGKEGMRAHCDSDDRLYVFVAPHSVKSTAEDKLTASGITIAAMLRQLVRLYLRQATFHDWITAEGVNQDIRVLDVRAGQLAKAIIEEKVDVATLEVAATQMNGLLNEEPEPALARLREQYSELYAQVREARGEAAAETFAKGIAVIEAAADLQDNDKMKIIAVIAEEHELAGSGLAAFAGFFKQSFREHDYYVGRMKTRKYLQRGDVKHILGVSEWPNEEKWKSTPFQDPSGVTLPVTPLQLVRRGFLPAMAMILIRPFLLMILLLVALLIAGLLFGVWDLCRHIAWR